jgi:hypothetical protein
LLPDLRKLRREIWGTEDPGAKDDQAQQNRASDPQVDPDRQQRSSPQLESDERRRIAIRTVAKPSRRIELRNGDENDPEAPTQLFRSVKHLGSAAG